MYIFDLDGTLADITHRVHHVRDGNRRWKQFFAECVNDKPKHDIIYMTQILGTDNRVEVWSGRSDEVRLETELWLDSWEIHYDHLLMRRGGDYTKDSELKEMWLHSVLNEGGTVEGVFDDRQQVVDMWRRNGITCFQVAPGDF